MRVAAVAGLLGDAVEDLPAGTVVAQGFIAVRPVPWKVYTRMGKPPADYVRFQIYREDVAAVSLDFRRLGGPYSGPSRLDAAFYLNSAGRQKPDRDNLAKAFTDAIQGTLIVNDASVWCGESVRIWRPDVVREGIDFRLVAVPEACRGGPIDGVWPSFFRI